ncbi:MAG: hypothetical protein IJH96_01645 [Ruminococcus sp.]|nr:hypothetical protein [Ruminococcus sp.]
MARTKKTAETAEKDTKKTVKATETKAAKAKAEKAEEKKAPAKKVSAKKTAPKKVAPKKPESVKAKIAEFNAKRNAEKVEPQVDFFVEFAGVQVDMKKVVADVKATIGKDVKEISVYLKPQESKAYFVADGENGEMDVYFC